MPLPFFSIKSSLIGQLLSCAEDKLPLLPLAPLPLAIPPPPCGLSGCTPDAKAEVKISEGVEITAPPAIFASLDIAPALPPESPPFKGVEYHEVE